MAKTISVVLEGVETHFDFKNLDRAKLYGRRVRMLLDSDGEPFTRASLTMDGSTLVRAGMTAQGYFDQDGTWIPNRDLVGLDPDGHELDRIPSTLGEPQPLRVAQAFEVLDMRLQAV
ncbi:MAG: hypothetical protein GY913_31840 [Proteobacteria bacterium]|nr:hypothetical protein [Pseudomonadota bacterium]MCP4921512.1 hypothetical protein [Pseudomonadota bacterium]